MWVNEGFTRLSGYALAEVAGRTPGAVLGSDRTPPETLARLAQAMALRQAVQAQVCDRAKDGREYWVDVDMQPLHDEHGALTGFVEVQSDITEQVLQGQHMAKLIETMPVGMLVYDAAGVIRESNTAACRILGQSAEQLQGRAAADPRWHRVREDGTDMPAAVSYTHLDVYKRQATTLGVGCVLIASAGAFAVLGQPSLHEFLISLFLVITAPVSAHLVVKALLKQDPSLRPPAPPAPSDAASSLAGAGNAAPR